MGPKKAQPEVGKKAEKKIKEKIISNKTLVSSLKIIRFKTK